MKTVLIGMSGGVDSSVAAYLLKQQGYHVIGINLQLYPASCAAANEEDVRHVCEKIGIEYLVLDYKKEFSEKVIDVFIEEYSKGRTPNPCCHCNKHMKFKQLLDKAEEIGAEYIATGHYANIKQLENGRYTIAFSDSSEKDQSYALYGLSQQQLVKTLMPLSTYTKSQVRQIAEEVGLLVAQKKDSQDICFVEDGDYAGFIEKRTGRQFRKGNFVLKDGTIIGKHEGVINYTIGQRKGLGIALGKKTFVIKVDMEKNQVVLGDNEDIFTYTLKATDLNFMAIEKLEEEMQAQGKIRYSHKPSECTIKMIDETTLECTFKEKQRAVTPGQAVVFYKDHYILCGGTIL